MKAIIHDTYGAPETLAAREVERPVIGDHDVLVRVHAAGLHIGDVFAVTGKPFLVRLSTGIRRPSNGIPGFDLAGTVTAVGRAVTRFAVGDEVFGASTGTAAEYVKAAEDHLVPKPANLTWLQAAAIPTSGLAALNGLRDAGRIRAGQKVLINGASGGVGTFAVQIAKSFGAHVTGVTSTRNVDLVRSLGADEVIDYTREDFTRRTAGYDVIFDLIENRKLADVRRALTPNGTLVLNSGTGATGLRMLVRLVRPILLSPFSSQSLRRFLSTPNAADLAVLKDLVEAGKLEPAIDRSYELDETVEALRHIESGRARGKVVLSVLAQPQSRVTLSEPVSTASKEATLKRYTPVAVAAHVTAANEPRSSSPPVTGLPSGANRTAIESVTSELDVATEIVEPAAAGVGTS
jgi:NADPH:quinone reductase-like Zn-dependent oxidoreductase